jgi:hypothetical protein
MASSAFEELSKEILGLFAKSGMSYSVLKGSSTLISSPCANRLANLIISISLYHSLSVFIFLNYTNVTALGKGEIANLKFVPSSSWPGNWRFVKVSKVAGMAVGSIQGTR